MCRAGSARAPDHMPHCSAHHIGASRRTPQSRHGGVSSASPRCAGSVRSVSVHAVGLLQMLRWVGLHRYEEEHPCRTAAQLAHEFLVEDRLAAARGRRGRRGANGNGGDEFMLWP